MVEKATVILFHASLAIFFIISWIGIRDLGLRVWEVKKKPLGLETRFMTNWNFAVQTILFYGYLLHDILDLSGIFASSAKRFKKLLDFYFYSISAPLSIFIAIVFWGMYSYDKKLMVPPGLDNLLPLWLNHAIHTIIVINVLIQAYFNKVSSIKLSKSLFAFSIFNLCYFACLYGTYFQMKVWVYPFLGLVEEPYRMLSLLGLFLASIIIKIVFYSVNSWYCKTCSQVSRAGQQKKK